MTLVFEIEAVAVIVEIKEISSVNKVAIAGINRVITIFLCELFAAMALLHEARCFTKAVLLAIEFRDTELSLCREELSVIAMPGCSRLFALVTR